MEKILCNKSKFEIPDVNEKDQEEQTEDSSVVKKVQKEILPEISDDSICKIDETEFNSNLGRDCFNNDYFKSLVTSSCDPKTLKKAKNVGTAMGIISGANKIKSRYGKILKFLGKVELVTPAIERQ